MGILSIMAVQGVTNLQSQWDIIGEFSNVPQEELLDWIKDNTSPSENFCCSTAQNQTSHFMWPQCLTPASMQCSCRCCVCWCNAHHGECETVHRKSHSESPALWRRRIEVHMIVSILQYLSKYLIFIILFCQCKAFDLFWLYSEKEQRWCMPCTAESQLR